MKSWAIPPRMRWDAWGWGVILLSSVSLSNHLSGLLTVGVPGCFAFKSPLFYLIMVPKSKSSDAGKSGTPKRSHKVLPLSVMVKVLALIRKEKNHMLRLLRFMVRMNLLSMKLWRRKGEFLLVLLLHLEVQKLWPVCDKQLHTVKLYVCTIRYFERERPHSYNFYHNILL